MKAGTLINGSQFASVRSGSDPLAFTGSSYGTITAVVGVEDFIESSLTKAKFNGGTSGAGAAVVGGATTAGRYGIVSIGSTGGVATACIDNHNTTGSIPTPINLGSGECRFRYDVLVDTASDGTDTYNIVVGLSDTMDTTQGMSAFLAFSYTHSVNSGNWVCNTRTYGASVTQVNTSVAAVSASWQVLEIIVNAAGTLATFYINGASVGSFSSNIPRGTTTTSAMLVAFQKTAGATARSISVDRIAWHLESTAAQ